MFRTVACVTRLNICLHILLYRNANIMMTDIGMSTTMYQTSISIIDPCSARQQISNNYNLMHYVAS